MISETGIWTWGHVIYDYRGFLKNMRSLGMDKITIWNDYAPINAREIIEEAHKNGIRVIWGFAWGWDTDCRKIAADLSAERLNKISESVVGTFREQYYDIAVDGIYFQSFTELDKRDVGGKNIASTVVELVNMTADELLSEHPQLNIEFGLHATGVKSDLDAIARTDGRVRIVWEDLGAFPFSYSPLEVENFDETYELTEKVLNLRGDGEKCGFITKGMTTLDWGAFSHAAGPLVIGESSAEFIKSRQLQKNALWEERTEGWHKNIVYAKKMFDLFKASDKAVSVQALIEDGMFENEIKEPPLMFSRLCKG